jgi:hypothetical protein
MRHPWLLQICDFRRDETTTEAALSTLCFNHAVSCRTALSLLITRIALLLAFASRQAVFVIRLLRSLPRCGSFISQSI